MDGYTILLCTVLLDLTSTSGFITALIKNPQILSETFNNYFSNIVEESVIKINKKHNNDLSKHSYMHYLVNAFQQPFSPINMKSVTEKEIYEISKSLKWKTSYGYGNVPSWTVKLSMSFTFFFYLFIYLVFQRSIRVDIELVIT